MPLVETDWEGDVSECTSPDTGLLIFMKGQLKSMIYAGFFWNLLRYGRCVRAA
jgi:hypothetical protein